MPIQAPACSRGLLAVIPLRFQHSVEQQISDCPGWKSYKLNAVDRDGRAQVATACAARDDIDSEDYSKLAG